MVAVENGAQVATGQRRTRPHRIAATILAASIALTGCFFGGDDDDAEPDGSTPTTLPDRVVEPGEPIVTVAGAGGTAVGGSTLGITLNEGIATESAASSAEVIAGTPLTADETAALIARLPAWNVSDDDRTDFRLPVPTLTPPEADSIDASFPPEVAADPDDTPDLGPLEVVRFQPQGVVDVAPFLAVTFNQPMVPLATLDQLDARDVPVSISPAVDGRWRWIGTRTLRFEVDPGVTDRLPAATEFTVEIPAGTTSEAGAALGEAVTWTFRTPAPSVRSLANGNAESLPVSPVFVAVFDQLIDPDAVLNVTELVANGTEHPIRLATDAEIEADEPARRAVAGALDGRWFAFIPDGDLEPDADLTITIGPGIPSAEGPLTSTAPVEYSGRTFGPFEIREAACGSSRCEPGESFRVRFNNAIDPDAFEADMISVEPAIPGLRIEVSGANVWFSGATAGRSTYSISIDADLRDEFGQRLGGERNLEWVVGSADPGFIGLSRQRFTIDPAAETATVSVQSINHDSLEVTAWSVTPNDLDAFDEFLDRLRRSDVVGAPDADESESEESEDAESEQAPWPVVLRETVAVDAEPDVWTETAIDLTSAFDLGGSQLVVLVETTERFSTDDDRYWRNRPSAAWVQRTTLGLDAFVDDATLVIWATDLLTGEAVDGVPVELLGDGRTATTDEAGLATVELGDNGVLGLWAAVGDRTAFTPADRSGGWTARAAVDTANWFVFDDRGVYRPGETVRLTGWVRRLALSDDSSLQLPGADASISYTATDAQGIEIAAGTLRTNRLGGFHLAIEIPAGANLGPSRVDFRLDDPATLELDGRSTNHIFQIQEFRRPEFEVAAQVETPAPQYAATPATVSVAAEYFSGGPLPDADVDWVVSTSDTTYRPPNWSDFDFGVWRPWWFAGDEFGGAADVAECFDCGFEPFGIDVETFEGRTDASGRHFLQIDFDATEADLPHSVNAQATVFDLDRQAWSSSTSLLVHPATTYVGLRTDRPFVERGTPIRIEGVVTDIDGATVAGRPVTVTAGRVDWAYESGRWTEVLVDESICELTSTDDANDGSMRCEFDTEVGGQYRVSAVVEDAAGDRSRSEISVWVSGGRGRPTRAVERETVTIIPDRETYRPGDVAELLIQAPWDNGHGLVTVTHRGIVLTEHIETEDGSARFELPIEDGWLPNIDVQVDLVGVAERTDDDGTPRPDLPARPAFAVGTARLSIPPIDRTLAVTATPTDTELTPGGTTSVTVAVAGADGRPVSDAGVALVVVDEAVLSLTDYQLRDPLTAFYPAAWSRLRSQYLRETILLDRTDLFGAGGEVPASGRSADGVATEMAADESADIAGTGAPKSGGEGIDLRTDFDALAVYTPDATTGADGTVTIDVPLPDTLTRYRVMAVAVDGAERFGVGESAITARLPLQVRPSAPRFLNFGDRAELPVVLQNQSDRALEVDVAIQVSNLALDGPAGTRITVPAGDRVEVRFPVSTDRTGTARARIVAASGSFTDAASVAMPVYTPATAEAFATYGVIDEGATAQTVLAPTDVIPGFGGLEITSSATAVQALTDAVLYLVDYPYESADAYASRIMAIAALRDVLDAFDADGLPPAAEIEAQVETDLRALAALQNGDGGFATWQPGRESRPWTSVQAAHALVLADEAGYRVPDDTLARALEYVSQIEDALPFDLPQRSRDAVLAYALHVRHRAGQPVGTDADALFATRGDELEIDALALIWPAITDADRRDTIERRIGNSVVETAGAATFATGYTEDDFLIAPSNRRTDGIILDALITELPESDLIVKTVTGLLAGRTQGRWNSAQENAFILLALERYFETFESVTPEFVARAWLGDAYVAESTFEGRTTERYNTLVPIDLLLEPSITPADGSGEGDDAEPPGDDDPSRTLILAKEGDGRLYYRLGLRYAPADLRLPARDEGFVVQRRFEAVDDDADVTRDADGTWRIAAGATVRVTVTMVADARRTDVALVDPFAAGLEAVNPSLATSGSITADASTRPGWWWSWFEHQNLRDDRAEAFATFLGAGTYEYSYVARATTPGEFVVPPARAEQIYSPEVFGRSGTDVVIVG